MPLKRLLRISLQVLVIASCVAALIPLLFALALPGLSGLRTINSDDMRLASTDYQLSASLPAASAAAEADAPADSTPPNSTGAENGAAEGRETSAGTANPADSAAPGGASSGSAPAPVDSQPETDPSPIPPAVPLAPAATPPAPPATPNTAPALFTAEGDFASHILAFYGKPGSKALGILGQYDKQQLGALLMAYSDLYDKANGEMAVLPAFYLLFGLCWPEGEIGYTPRSVLEDYIKFAASQGWLVFIDHQIGRYTVAEAMKTMLPYLQFPNVHLALDPEWRTTLPMKEIGTMSAAEFNEAQALMDSYLAEHQLPGRRMLIVHQFHPRMLTEPQLVRTDFPRVLPVHVADGIGNPALKRYSYAQNARFTNMPVKGFKLFFESKVAGARWDIPLMTPDEVLQLQPQPVIIMYQ